MTEHIEFDPLQPSGRVRTSYLTRHYWLYLGALLGLGVPFPAASVLAADLPASMYGLGGDLSPVAGHA